MAERGIDASNETVRRCIARFGPQIARNLQPVSPEDLRAAEISGQRNLT